MIFTETELPGAYVLDLERREDQRGFFARVWCIDELRERGLETRIVQASVAFNKRKGTLRGMHMQSALRQSGRSAGKVKKRGMFRVCGGDFEPPVRFVHGLIIGKRARRNILAADEDLHQ